MLPYFGEYKEYLSENYNNDSAKTQIMRLVKLDRAEKNLLDMSAEEMFDIVEVDKKTNSTLNAVYGCIELYLKWLSGNYKLPVYNCSYEMKRLKTITTQKKYTESDRDYFANFTELKTYLLKAEEDYLQEQVRKVSGAKLDGIYIKQKMFNAYTVFLWEQIEDKEMLTLSLEKIMTVITSKQIVIDEKIVELSDDEVDFISEAFDTVTKLHKNIEDRRYRSKVNKRKFTIETYDNLFNASNINILKNLKWDALGNSVSDQRLQIFNIIKAGVFCKLSQYEIKNDYVFCGKKGFEVCSELFNVSLSKAQRYISEYNKFKHSLESKQELPII